MFIVVVVLYQVVLVEISLQVMIILKIDKSLRMLFIIQINNIDQTGMVARKLLMNGHVMFV